MELVNCSRYDSGECVAPSNPQPVANFHKCPGVASGHIPNCKLCRNRDKRMRYKKAPPQYVEGMRWLTIEAHRKLEARQA